MKTRFLGKLELSLKEEPATGKWQQMVAAGMEDPTGMWLDVYPGSLRRP